MSNIAHTANCPSSSVGASILSQLMQSVAISAQRNYRHHRSRQSRRGLVGQKNACSKNTRTTLSRVHTSAKAADVTKS